MTTKKKTDDKVTGCAEYDALTKQMDDARAKIADMGKAAVGALFKKFFADNPKATAIGWTQYTPYFNDGEPCEFGLHEFYYTTKEGVNFEEVSSFYDDEEEHGFKNTYTDAAKGEKTIKEAVSTLVRAADSGLFETAFGDHAQIIATPAGFHVTEYSHD